MKSFFLTLICSLTFSVVCIAQITGNQRFDATDFTISDTVGADQITYSFVQSASLYHAGSAGAPQLPVQYKNWLIPYGAVIDSIAITDNSYIEISLQHNIFPVQPDIPAGLMPPPSFQGIDTNIYFSDLPYPVQLIHASGNGYWHNANIATIAIYPYKYFPSDSLLKFYSSLSYTIYYSFPHGQISPDTLRADNDNLRAYKQQLGGMIENDTDIDSFLENILITSSYKKNIGNLPIADYIVIVPDATFKASQALNDFIFWKQKRGINIAVVTKEEIHNQYNGQVDAIGNIVYNNNNSIGGPAAEIRLYLYDVWEELGINFKYVLLVGDENMMPVREIKPTSAEYQDALIPTDKYFADYTSDYEVNNNSLYGEYSIDKVDYYQEVCVGRIPCASLSEFTIWVEKLIDYESNPTDADFSYNDNYISIMADEFQRDYNESLTTGLPFANKTIYKELPTYNDTNPVTTYGSDIISQLINKPAGYWTWLVHGNPGSIITMSRGVNADTRSWINIVSSSFGLLALNNKHQPGIVHSASCSVASFQGTSNCLAQAYLFNSNGGGVAFSGNTDLGWISQELSKFSNIVTMLNYCHNGGFTINQHIGNLENQSYVPAPIYIVNKYETFMVHNFFGDPEMRYYTKAPVRLVANVLPRHIIKADNNIVNLNITNIAYGDIVYIGMYQKPSVIFPNGYQRIKEITGVQGIFSDTLNFPPDKLSEGNLYITISGFNYLPFTDNILVSPGCTFVNSPESIMSTQTMPFQYFKDHDIVVETGVTLTITGELYFVPQAKLIVKPGARLVLDGGTIGSSCNSLWQGVEVWGKYNLPQNILNQGVIEIKNNGCITNAECAIKAYNPKASNPTTTSGGIVAIRKAKFINNKCCIALYPLYNTANIYNSYIQNSIFSIDNNYMLQSGYPTKMIALEGFKSVNIEGCTFSNTNQKLEGENRGNAISATNAGMKINKLCIEASPLGDCITYSPMVFNGWHYAIHTNNCNPNHVIEIVNSSFYSNLRGIYLSSVSLPKIQRNTFKTIKRNQFEPPSSGLYLNACTGYSVQENTFDGNYAGTNTYETGIVINNSGTALNEIYNNSFTKLQNGITAQDDNRGLVCKCNDYAGVKTDQSVLITGGSSSTIGIALYQGDSLSVTGLAGNTFSQRSIGGGTYDLFNQGARFKYYHHANTPTKRLEPNPQLCTNVYLKQWNAYPYDKITSCPSKLNSGGSGLEEMKVELQSTSTSVQQKETELQALVDGGTTEQTTEDIIYSIPPEALTLRDELLTKSPYLSDTVMQSAAANEFVLPNVMIRDILVANPQSASSEQVLSELDKRIEPMPEDLYNQILDAEAAYSPLEIREMKLASLKAKQTWLFNSVVAHYLSDTTGYLGDSLNVVLQNAPFPEGRYLLALRQMAEKDTTAAASTLQAIPSSFELSDKQQVIFNDFLSYFEILKEMNNDTLPGTETDSIQTVSLFTLLTNAHEPVKSNIRNILIANEAITYVEPYLFADELKTSRIRKPNLINNEGNAMLQISPIPATDYFIVKYDLNNQIAPATLEVVSIYGQVLLSKQLNKYTDQFVVPLTGFSPGIYIVSIRVRDQVLDNCRLIVVK